MGTTGSCQRTAGVTVHRAWTVVVVSCLCFPASRAAALPLGRDIPPRLVLESGLLAQLRTLSLGLRNEIVLCLTGAADSLTVVATGFVMADPHLSSSDRATFGPCPDATVAIWHNHPLAAPREASTRAPSVLQMADPQASPRDLCALSETDIQTTAREGSPFVVVAVGANTWCWWSHAQVRALAERGASRGDPVPGQIVSHAVRDP